jgi:hypothetical protein
MKTSNKKYTLKNESIYPLRKFRENAPLLQSLFEDDFLFYFLGIFAKFLKAAVSFVMSVCPRGTTWLPLDGFS